MTDEVLNDFSPIARTSIEAKPDKGATFYFSIPKETVVLPGN